MKEKDINRKNFIKATGGFLQESVYHFIHAYKPELIDKLTQKEQFSIPKKMLFPPGAVKNYLEQCTACELCVEVCPHGSILMVEDEASGKEVAKIDPYISACYLCKDIPCSKVCPDGALEPIVNRLDINLGFAAATFHCLNQKAKEKLCDKCQQVCPFLEQCISFNSLHIPMVNKELCTGCGICAQYCPENGIGMIVFPKSDFN